jgi:hypothetical protein
MSKLGKIGQTVVASLAAILLTTVTVGAAAGPAEAVARTPVSLV